MKRATAKTNLERGLIEEKIGGAIVLAATEVVDGKYNGQFPVDVFEDGSGAATNAKINEVIANRANEILGGPGHVRPIDHVNLGQTCEEVVLTAIHVGTILAIHNQLLSALRVLPVRVEDWFVHAERAVMLLREVPVSKRVAESLTVELGVEMKPRGHNGCVEAIGELKALADQLAEMAKERRKLAGVKAESLIQVCLWVAGTDLVVRLGMSRQWGEVGVALPLIGAQMLESVHLLANGCCCFAEACGKAPGRN